MSTQSTPAERLCKMLGMTSDTWWRWRCRRCGESMPDRMTHGECADFNHDLECIAPCPLTGLPSAVDAVYLGVLWQFARRHDKHACLRDYQGFQVAVHIAGSKRLAYGQDNFCAARALLRALAESGGELGQQTREVLGDD